jgi:hypothetical protein
MNLSSLVHVGRVQQQQEQIQRAEYTTQAMASSLVSNPYLAQNSYAYISTPQAPPSPPVEEAPKCSLPSISSLLGLSDEREHTHTQGDLESPADKQTEQERQQQQQTRGLPPTPPMQSDSGFDGRQSPSASSQYSVVSAPSSYYYAPSVNNVESHQQRQTVPVPRRVSYSQFSPQQSMYYPSPMQPTPPPQVQGLYYQRPLPQVSSSPSPASQLPTKARKTDKKPRRTSHRRSCRFPCPSPPQAAPTHGNTTTTSRRRRRRASRSRRTDTSARPATRHFPVPAA